MLIISFNTIAHSSDVKSVEQESGDTLEQWKLKSQKKLEEELGDNYEKNVHQKMPTDKLDAEENGRAFMFVGDTTYLYFSESCEPYYGALGSQLPRKETTSKKQCIEYDFNDDGNLDFLIKLSSPEVCKVQDRCPVYLFVQIENEQYQKYHGPFITGNKVAAQLVKKNPEIDPLGSLVFMSGGTNCEWKWKDGSNQDYVCFREHRMQKPTLRDMPSSP